MSSIELSRPIESYNKCLKCSLSALTQAHNRFTTRLLPCRDTLFEVSPEIRCSELQVCQVARPTVVMATAQLVLSQLKNFLLFYLYQKTL